MNRALATVIAVAALFAVAPAAHASTATPSGIGTVGPVVCTKVGALLPGTVTSDLPGDPLPAYDNEGILGHEFSYDRIVAYALVNDRWSEAVPMKWAAGADNVEDWFVIIGDTEKVRTVQIQIRWHDQVVFTSEVLTPSCPATAAAPPAAVSPVATPAPQVAAPAPAASAAAAPVCHASTSTVRQHRKHHRVRFVTTVRVFCPELVSRTVTRTPWLRVR